MPKITIKVFNLLVTALLFIIFVFFGFNTKAQIVTDLPKCVSSTCLNSLTDVVVSKDGSFFLAVDSIQNAYLRKFEFSSGGIANDFLISLGRLDLDEPNLKIEVSKDNKKAFVYNQISDNQTNAFSRVLNPENNKPTILNQVEDSCRCGGTDYFDGNVCVMNATLDCPNPTSDTVCGCNGAAYLNSCISMSNGIKVFTKGGCGSQGSFSCLNDDQCPLATCPNGKTYKRLSCTNGMCILINFTTDPCPTSVETTSSSSGLTTSCKCPSGAYFDGTNCVTGSLDCTSSGGVLVTDTVCGCDKLNYLNICVAQANGIKKFTKGNCGSDGDFSCSSDSQCPLGSCSNGQTFKRFTCASSMCAAIEFSSDPCLLTTSSSGGINISSDNSKISVIDLTNNSVTSFNPVSLSGNFKQTFSVGSFLDSTGKRIILSNNDDEFPKLLIINLSTGKTETEIPLPKSAQLIKFSPGIGKAIIIFKDLKNSIGIFTNNGLGGGLTNIDIPNKIFFKTSGFLNKINFDLSGSKAVLSSSGVKHILYLVDLRSNRLVVLFLNNKIEGEVLSTVSPDGSFAVSAGKTNTGFIVYKTNIVNPIKAKVVKSVNFNEPGEALDISITPDKHSILLLVKNGNEEKIKMLDLKDLGDICEIPIVNDASGRQLLNDPYGRYTLIPDFTGNEINLVTQIPSGPVFRSINPNFGPSAGGINFEIDGFVDSSNSTDDVMVCFGSNRFCSTSNVLANDGMTISGTLPKMKSPFSKTLILFNESESVSSSNQCKIKNNNKSSYQGVFTFIK